MSDKIKPHHLGRKAILYVRQSSAHQVLHNQESRFCNTQCAIGSMHLAGGRLKWWTTISAARRRVQPFALALNGR
jgi:hypothetical protein